MDTKPGADRLIDTYLSMDHYDRDRAFRHAMADGDRRRAGIAAFTPIPSNWLERHRAIWLLITYEAHVGGTPQPFRGDLASRPAFGSAFEPVHQSLSVPTGRFSRRRADRMRIVRNQDLACQTRAARRRADDYTGTSQQRAGERPSKERQMTLVDRSVCHRGAASPAIQCRIRRFSGDPNRKGIM